MNTKGLFNVIVVNFRTPDLTVRCIESLLALNLAASADMVVVENASPDDSYSRLRNELPEGVRLVRASMNRGFGAGVNMGMVAGKRDHVLVLNPDTYFVDQSIGMAMTVFEESPEVGMVGLDLTFPDGRRQYSARRFYSVLDIVGRRTRLGSLRSLHGRMERHMMVEAWTPGIVFDADWVMGTGFIVKRTIYEELGGMDEGYFLYMEDVDLCARIWATGHRIVCVPGARLMHDYQRNSAKSGPLSRAGRYHLQSFLRFRNKFRIPLALPPGIDGVHR
ncbi:glycosyltransferase family 2 protein [Caballeronia sp. LjRoot31]|jgi:N-acetylglucosaminyl-diphospho-decaprenol L-rhamnosyltransferase|uniref:glycosyltransferase family 2 protein n=1 Tax=Caballeronia sp. LjRoot31 TaxID=3342324 RepID=UPI003ED14D1C